MKEYKSFFTGSRVYGTPKPDSDLDMVILVEDEKEREEILSLRDNPNKKMVTFGNINLIVVKCQLEYDAWYQGTELLEKKKPVTKKEAKALISQKLEIFGIWTEYEEDGQVQADIEQNKIDHENELRELDEN